MFTAVVKLPAVSVTSGPAKAPREEDNLQISIVNKKKKKSTMYKMHLIHKSG